MEHETFVPFLQSGKALEERMKNGLLSLLCPLPSLCLAFLFQYPFWVLFCVFLCWWYLFLSEVFFNPENSIYVYGEVWSHLPPLQVSSFHAPVGWKQLVTSVKMPAKPSSLSDLGLLWTLTIVYRANIDSEKSSDFEEATLQPCTFGRSYSPVM